MRVLLIIACSFLVGCANPAYTIKTAAKLGTVTALYQMKASVQEAEQIKMIALSVESTIDDTGSINLDAVRQQIVAQIADLFSGAEEVLLIALADEILALIAVELGNIEPGPGLTTFILYVKAGATGVKEGAQLYIDVHTPTSSFYSQERSSR